MRIDRAPGALEHERRLKHEIARAADMHPVAGRVCGSHCTLSCFSCGRGDCGCACSPDCVRASSELSADAGKYPIEPAVLPLVFEMKRLEIFTPCWSCEGHPHPDGSLWKLPSVWFYCESLVHVRLLAAGVAEMKLAGRLAARWNVSVTYSDPDNPDTTFALEPVVAPDAPATLMQMRADLGAIARALKSLMSKGALKLQGALSR